MKWPNKRKISKQNAIRVFQSLTNRSLLQDCWINYWILNVFPFMAEEAKSIPNFLHWHNGKHGGWKWKTSTQLVSSLFFFFLSFYSIYNHINKHCFVFLLNNRLLLIALDVSKFLCLFNRFIYVFCKFFLYILNIYILVLVWFPYIP